MKKYAPNPRPLRPHADANTASDAETLATGWRERYKAAPDHAAPIARYRTLARAAACVRRRGQGGIDLTTGNRRNRMFARSDAPRFGIRDQYMTKCPSVGASGAARKRSCTVQGFHASGVSTKGHFSLRRDTALQVVAGSHVHAGANSGQS